MVIPNAERPVTTEITTKQAKAEMLTNLVTIELNISRCSCSI